MKRAHIGASRDPALETSAATLMGALITRGGTHDVEVLARTAMDHALALRWELELRLKEQEARR